MSALALDVDVGSVVLGIAGKAWSSSQTHVEDSITGGTIERTIDGASTLTFELEDAQRVLLRSGIFSDQIDLPYGGQWWRLVKVSKSGEALTLTFEDRVVSMLRKQTKVRKATRSKMTRAEFVLSLVQELRPPPPFVCPELHTTQKVAIETSSQALTQPQRKASASGGFAPGSNLTVKGAKATPEQIGNAQRALDVAASLSCTGRVMVALIEACITESTLKNLNYGDRDSLGILQVRSSTAGPMGIDNRNIEQCVNAFLTRGFFTNELGGGGAIVIAAKHPEATPGQIAQGCQGSAPAAYSQWQAEAERWVAAYGGDPTGATPLTSTKAQPFQFQRGGTSGDGSNSWDTMTKLASDVNWHCFVLDGAVWFVSEKTLIAAQPVADISEDTLGIDAIDFDVDNGKANSEATVSCRASRWAFAPGSVVMLHDCGPGDGRWLVESYSRGLFDASATVTLKRETLPLREPAPTSTTVSSTGGVSGADPFGQSSALSAAGATGSGVVSSAYAAAQAIDAKVYPYVWGGGHSHCGTPDGGIPGGPGGGIGLTGYDCSGSTCAVLAAAGMGFRLGGPAQGSGSIASSWGAAGEGKLLTVWANTIHVWMEFKPPGKPAQHFGTGAWGISNPGGGPRFQAEMHTKDGFTPRHWPGES